MHRRALLAASALVLAAMAAIALAVGSALPGDVALPTHWGVDGRPDAFSDKWTALFMPLVIALPALAICYAVPAMEPRREGLERSRGLYVAVWVGLLLISLLIQLAVVSVALKWPLHGTTFVLAGVGILFILVGNQLGKSGRTYLMGIRTPWTLASAEVWAKTHRLGGKLMVGAGALLLLCAFVPLPSGVIVTLLIVAIGGSTIIPVGYSFLLWRREQRGRKAVD